MLCHSPSSKGRDIIVSFIFDDKLPSFDIQYYGNCGPGSVVGIATGYGLDGLGIESR
jgi:hypothetical protein